MLKSNINKRAGLLLALLGASPAAARTRTRPLMGTLCEISARGPGDDRGITAAFDEIARLERVMSTYMEDSELSRLNREGSARVSEDLWAVLAAALARARDSKGAFDPTFSSPAAARGWRKVRLDPSRRSVRLDPGARLDLGGIGKGYALDAAARALRREGVDSAMLNFGGQILVLGRPPEGGAWPVELSGLRLLLRRGSLSVSSQRERPGHIVDPRTGGAVPRSDEVAVVAGTALEADGWSTALFVDPGARAAFPGCVIEPGPPPVFSGPCPEYLEPHKEKT